jgi:serine/threonine-protein kinase
MAADSLLTEGVHEGDILAGKYRIDRLLGAGGMGVVVAAHHLHLDEHVAIKFLLPEVLDNAEIVGRFTREARAAVKIKSEHVARMIDVGTLDNGAPYMVMEYLDGYDLGSWLGQHGPLSIELAVEFLLQACEAIAEAHGLGIVHRDLKPDNLYCIKRPDGTQCIKVLDFGISKTTNSSISGADFAMTRTTTIVGSPLYMSPEQLRSSRDVDRRADVWALGVILFEFLTGGSPFNGDSLPELCLAIVSEPTPSVRAMRPDVPEELEIVINRCLEKNRDQRIDNVAELATALAPFAPQRSRISIERILGISRSTGVSSGAISVPGFVLPNPTIRATAVSWGNTAATEKPPRRSWVFAGVVASVCIVAAAVAVTLSVSSRKASTGQEHLTPPNSGLMPASLASPGAKGAEPGQTHLAAVPAAESQTLTAAPAPSSVQHPVETAAEVAGEKSLSPAATASTSAHGAAAATAAGKRYSKAYTSAPRAKTSTRAALKRGVYDDMQ